MDTLRRTPTTLERRQAVFRLIERDKYNIELLQLDLLHMMQLITQVGCGLALGVAVGGAITDGLADWNLWRYAAAAVGGIVAGAVAFILAYIPFELINRLITRRRFRRITEGSTDELWRSVDRARGGLWNYWDTIALLQLAARGEDVSPALPSIIKMLESSHNADFCRRHAWDALRLVFFDEAEAMRDYNPTASAEDCRAKVARLKELLGQRPPQSSNTTAQPAASENSQQDHPI
jgi:hypothetical protein